MIKFFRKIRQGLLNNNKLRKYLLYSIGEIILVVIGILIALSINNWNESNKLSKKELGLLFNLKKELDRDISLLRAQDSICTLNIANAEVAIKLIYKDPTIKDMISIDSLIIVDYLDLLVTRNTYNEMVSTGSLYILKNKEIQKLVMTYYFWAEKNTYYFRQFNSKHDNLKNLTPELNPYNFLVSQIKNPEVDVNSIDTSWINNKNSNTYLALINFLHNYRKILNEKSFRYKRMLATANNLKSAIEEELKDRNK